MFYWATRPLLLWRRSVVAHKGYTLNHAWKITRSPTLVDVSLSAQDRPQLSRILLRTAARISGRRKQYTKGFKHELRYANRYSEVDKTSDEDSIHKVSNGLSANVWQVAEDKNSINPHHARSMQTSCTLPSPVSFLSVGKRRFVLGLVSDGHFVGVILDICRSSNDEMEGNVNENDGTICHCIPKSRQCKA